MTVPDSQTTENKEVLIQWEITPQEEKSFNKKLIPLILLILFYMISRFFWDPLSSKTKRTPFDFVREEWNFGGSERYMAMFLSGAMVILFGLMIWTFYVLWRRSKGVSAEKFILTPTGLTTVSHDGREQFHPWQQFKGFIRTYWYGGAMFQLIDKNAAFPYLYPRMVIARGEKDNSEHIYETIKQFLPDMTSRYAAGWKITAIVLIVLGVIAGVVYGSSVTKPHPSPSNVVSPQTLKRTSSPTASTPTPSQKPGVYMAEDESYQFEYPVEVFGHQTKAAFSNKEGVFTIGPKEERGENFLLLTTKSIYRLANAYSYTEIIGADVGDKIHQIGLFRPDKVKISDIETNGVKGATTVTEHGYPFGEFTYEAVWQRWEYTYILSLSAYDYSKKQEARDIFDTIVSAFTFTDKSVSELESWETYRNDQFAFEFRYPKTPHIAVGDQDKTNVESYVKRDDPTAFVITFYNLNQIAGPYFDLSLYITTLPEEFFLTRFPLSSEIKKAGEIPRGLESKTISVAGISTKKYFGNSGWFTLLDAQRVLFRKDGRTYFFRFEAKPGSEYVFDEIISTLKFL